MRTIRDYEEAGLIGRVKRISGGFRLYTDDDIERLRLIKHTKPLELTLEEMGDLLAARDRLASSPDRAMRSEAAERLAM